MPLRRVKRLSVLVAAMLSHPAFAQMDHGQVQCSAPAPLPASLASWRSPVALKAAADSKASVRAAMTPGRTVTLALLRTSALSYAVRPEKTGGSVSYGGLASFTVAQAGTWRVALGSGAWIDVVKDGKAATSIAHGHGPDCTGIRKMVDYRLEPGHYTLQIAASAEESLTLAVTPLPS